jgi:hypothetical protein
MAPGRLSLTAKTLEGWQLFNGKPIPKGWDVADGWLHGQGKNGGDILSAGQFEQFELEWEWKIAPKGNSGLKYFVPDSRKEALGHEYQMLDESDAASAHPDKHTTASFYDVLPPKPGLPLKPAGEINQSRVRVAANHVEHWLKRREGPRVRLQQRGREERGGSQQVQDYAGFRHTTEGSHFAAGPRLRGLVPEHQTARDHSLTRAK